MAARSVAVTSSAAGARSASPLTSTSSRGFIASTITVPRRWDRRARPRCRAQQADLAVHGDRSMGQRRVAGTQDQAPRIR